MTREGYCCKCGDCCDPAFDEVRARAYIGAALEFEGRKVNRDKDDGCSAFDHETRLCTVYETRPASCRAFPLHPVEVTVLPRCTFTFSEEISK